MRFKLISLFTFFILFVSISAKSKVLLKDVTTLTLQRGQYTQAPFENEESQINWSGIIYFGIVCFILYLLYLTLSGPRPGHEGDRNRGDNSGGFPPGGGGGNPPPPPGFRPYPPSYDEATKQTFTSSTHAGSSGSTGQPAAGAAGGGGPGFFTGMGLGALGGYLYGNSGRNNDGGAYRRRGWFGGGGGNQRRGYGWGGALGGYLYGNSGRNNDGGAYRRRGWFGGGGGNQRRGGYGWGGGQFDQDTGFGGSSSTYQSYQNSPPSSSGTSSRHESTSFGGTTRR
uniref:Store-operated calcium entry-associated regulatory factor n=1 Tax=Panagrolaimus sp. ES5 TaxID=591445 RepID=A0AC34FFT6_9BILA